MKRLAGLVLCLLFAAAPAAAEIRIQATLDRSSAPVGEQVILTVEVSGGIQSLPEPKIPDLSADFQIYSGGTARNYSLVNGSLTASHVVRMVLVPRREGAFTIPPITVETKKEVISTEPLTLTVTRGVPPPAPPPAEAGEHGSTGGGEDVFVRATVDKPTATVYEQITCRVRLYARLPLVDIPGFSPPSTEGFLREELPRQDPRLETLNGQRYRVIEWAVALFPTAPGKLTVGETVLTCEVQVPMQGDPFFGGRFFGGKRMELRTEPLTVEVKPLSPGAPPGFHGTVGDFTLRASLDRNDVPQNDPVTLRLDIEGRGHVRTVGEIELPALADFRTYPSKSEESLEFQGNLLGGRLRREYVLVPLSTGDKTLAPVRLVTYSPTRRAYVVLETEPLPLTVTPPVAGRAPEGGIPGVGREGIEVVGRDIRFMETGVPEFHAAGGAWREARRWILLVPLPGLLYAGAWFWEGRRERLGRNRGVVRRRGAAREARKLLKEAHRAGPVDGPARAAVALRAYLADRYDLPRAGLTREDIERKLREESVDPSPILEFLETTDAARFAPVTTADGDWIEMSRGWIDRLEAVR